MGLEIHEYMETERSAVSEDKKHKEMANVSAQTAPVSLLISLHEAHRTATCYFKRRKAHTAITTDSVRSDLLELWRAGNVASFATPHVALILGDRLLASLRKTDTSDPNFPISNGIDAVLSARWGLDRLAWQPLESAQHTVALHTAEVASEARAGAMLSVTALKVAGDFVRKDEKLGEAMGRFALMEVGKEDPDVGERFVDPVAMAVAAGPLLDSPRSEDWERPEMWGKMKAVAEAGWVGAPLSRAKFAWLKARRRRL